MKKSLVLAMAMALGVTASAYAANPFSDVPAGHWAYDSVAELAAAGVVDGYSDGSFGGDKLMTRYEMAQITARAMANGADVDALAAEFAEELDTMGVRVANLEKKADNVKITGEIRAQYVDHDNKVFNSEEVDDSATLRTRLWVNGAINDNWSYTGMLEGTQDLMDNGGNDDLDLARAYVAGRLGGMDVVAGRWNEAPFAGSVMDVDLDGVKLSYGDKVKLTALAGKAIDDITNTSADRVYGFGAETTMGMFDLYAGYVKADDNNVGVDGYKDKEIYNVGVAANLNDDLTLSFDYAWGDKEYKKEVSKDGYVVGLNYKGAGAEVGSYGLHANYYDQPVNAYLAPTYDMTKFTYNDGGYEGWSVGADYTVAKNIQLSVNYYDSESKLNDIRDKAIFSEVNFFF